MPLFFYKYFQRTVLYRQTKMAVFGKIDSRALPAGVSVVQNSTQVTGSNFTTPGLDYIDAGDIIEILPDRAPYVVAEVVSATELRLSKPFAEASVNVAAPNNAFRRTPPKQVASYVYAPIDTVAREILLISTAEAQLAENKEKGLCSPGWWLWDTYTTAAGDTRYKANHIASISALGAAAIIGDDDTDGGVAADIASEITVGTLPAVTVTAGNIVTFDATAISATDQGTLTYTFQRQKTSNGRWANVTATLDGGIYDISVPGILTIAAPDVTTDLNGYEFRVKVNNTVGGEEVISNDALLTVS